jgi:hypothetical protein
MHRSISLPLKIRPIIQDSELSREAGRSSSVAPQLFVEPAPRVLVADQDSDYNKKVKIS